MSCVVFFVARCARSKTSGVILAGYREFVFQGKWLFRCSLDRVDSVAAMACNLKTLNSLV
jgi:hypothetical protein